MKRAVRWNTEITATVPLDATTGPVAVTTPRGTGTSTASFTVLATVTTRTRHRVAPTALRLGKYVKAIGLLTPTSLAGSRVDLSAQVRKGATWASVKTASATTTATGAYAWIHRATRKGSYRMRASIAATAAHAAARTKWVAFGVK